jgi:hypothetical protein
MIVLLIYTITKVLSLKLTYLYVFQRAINNWLYAIRSSWNIWL